MKVSLRNVGLVVLGLLMATGVWGAWVTGLQYWFQTDVKLPI